MAHRGLEKEQREVIVRRRWNLLFYKAPEVSSWVITRIVYVLQIMFNELPKLQLISFEK